MGFLQITTFRTDRAEELEALQQEWLDATAGERTLTGGQVFADRDDPTRLVSLDWFTDHASAMVNSGLPATTAMAEKARTLVLEEPAYLDLEPLGPPTMQGEAELRASFETGVVDRDAVAEDLVVDMLLPGTRAVVHGIDATEAGLASEGPGREFQLWSAQPTPTGFVAEYAYHTTGDSPILSVGCLIATVTEGRITRLLVTCAGAWDAEAEAEIVGRTGAFGPSAGGAR